MTEVGDGNINFVYIVKGPAGAVCLKQGLPFVRIAGDSWPLTQVGLTGHETAMLWPNAAPQLLKCCWHKQGLWEAWHVLLSAVAAGLSQAGYVLCAHGWWLMSSATGAGCLASVLTA